MWLRVQGDVWRCGLTQFAANRLGDVVWVEMPEQGRVGAGGEVFGNVESVKAVVELCLPVGGKITAVNEELVDEPETINSDPYGDAWIVEIAPDRPADADALMGADAYEAFIAREEDDD